MSTPMTGGVTPLGQAGELSAASSAGATGGATRAASSSPAYKAALQFEQMLVQQLAQQLAATVSNSSSDNTGTDGSSTDGSGASGLMGSDPASSAYAQLIPDALTSSIMSSGGLGIAQQLAGALDPALGVKR
jgi:Rod binding domain-containing protein